MYYEYRLIVRNVINIVYIYIVSTKNYLFVTCKAYLCQSPVTKVPSWRTAMVGLSSAPHPGQVLSNKQMVIDHHFKQLSLTIQIMKP